MKVKRSIDPSGSPLIRTEPEAMFENYANIPESSLARRYPLMVNGCGFSRWSKGASISRQQSYLFAIEMVISGKLKLIQNGHEYICGPGDCYIIQRRGFHSYGIDDKCQLLQKRWVTFTDETPGEIFERLDLTRHDVFHPLPASAREFISLHKRLFNELGKKTEGYENRVAVMAYELLLWACRCAGGFSTPTPVDACVNYMRCNLDRDLDVNALLSIANTSQTNLYRMFSSAFDDTPIGIMRKMRMKHAAALLQYSKKTLKEISRLAGYSNPENFTRTFRKEMGMSPRQYRVIHRRPDRVAEAL